MRDLAMYNQARQTKAKRNKIEKHKLTIWSFMQYQEPSAVRT